MTNCAQQVSSEFHLTAEIVTDTRKLQDRINDYAATHNVSENVRFISYLLDMTIKAAEEHDTFTLSS